MKKLLLLFPVLILLVLTTVSAEDVLLRHFTCDDTSGTALTDTSDFGVDGTSSSSSIWDASGKINGACGMDDAYYVDADFNSEIPAFTYMTWFKAAGTSVEYFIGEKTASNPYITLQTSTEIQIKDHEDTNNAFVVPTINTGTWYHLIATSSGTELRIYINNVESSTGAISSSCTWGATDTVQQIGKFGHTGGCYFNGLFDDIRFYNYTVDSAIRTFVYNSGTGTQDNDIPPIIINNTKANITIEYPANASTIGNTTEYPLLIYGNVTVQNGTLNNATINNTNWKNIGNQTYFNFTMNGTIVEGIHYFNISSISEYGNLTTEIIKFTIDFTEPAIKSTLSGNNTLIYAYENLTYNINVTDSEMVYSFNVSTTEGYSIEYTGVNTTKYLYNGSINVSDYGIGKHNLTTESCDAHTKNKIKDWEEIIGIDDRITYNFGSDYFFIRPLDPSLIEEVTTEKHLDRYSFTYKKNLTNKKEDLVFIVSSSQYIDIIGNNKKYSGWLVIPKIKKWIDFNTEDRKKLKYTITRLSDYSVAISIKGIKQDEFTFNSAGTLNCIRKDYAYYIYNYSVSYDTRAIAKAQTTLDLIITYKDIVLNSTSSITYNTTVHAVSNISSVNHFNYTVNITPQQYTKAETYINFSWGYTLNNTIFQTFNYTQTIDSIFLTYFGNLSNTSAINFTFWDENNNTNLSANINGDFNYLTNSILSPDLTDTTNLTVAIYPTGASTSGSYTVYYSATGYPERRYTETSAIYNNNTQVIKLYLLATDQGGYATFRIVDIYSSVIAGVTGTMQKVIAGSLVTVEQQLSDGSGIMTFFVDPDDDYTFSFSKTGYVTYTSTLRPITTELYTIVLEQEGVTPVASYSTGIEYFFTPSNTVLNNKTDYTFVFNLSSSYWDITACTLNLKNTTDTFISSSNSFTTRECIIKITANTGKNLTLISEATYTLNDTATKTVSAQYSIKYTYKGEFSFMNFIDDLKAFAGAGFNDFTRMIIAFIVIFAIVSYASSQLTALRDPESLIILAWGLVLFFSYVGFLTLNYDAIPEVRGLAEGWLKQYIIFIIFSLGAGSYIINKHR